MSCCLWLTWALLLVVVSFGGSVCFCGEVGRAVAVRSLIWGAKIFFRGHFKKRSRRIDTVTALPSSAPL